MSKKPKMSRAEAGRKGGRMTKQRHGRTHFQTIGKKGFMVTVARHWQGDKGAYVRWLHGMGWMAMVDRLFELSGETVTEIPLIPELDPDDDCPTVEDTEDEAEDALDYILRTIQSAPLPDWGGL
jgi:hypothetical protein